jgi:hypothetical protein
MLNRDRILSMSTSTTLSSFEHQPPTRPPSGPAYPSIRRYHYARLSATICLLIATILIIPTLIPGEFGPNNETNSPGSGLTVFSVSPQYSLLSLTDNLQFRLYQSFENAYGYSDIGTDGNAVRNVVVTLASTCASIELSDRGGGNCASNLLSTGWSRETLSQLSYVDFSVPAIATLAVFVMLAIGAGLAFVTSVLIFWYPGVTSPLPTPERPMPPRRSYQYLATTRPYLILGALVFILVLVGAILLQVQVSGTLSALRARENAEKFASIPGKSTTFWGLLWAAVILLGAAVGLLAADVYRYPDGQTLRSGKAGD